MKLTAGILVITLGEKIFQRQRQRLHSWHIWWHIFGISGGISWTAISLLYLKTCLVLSSHPLKRENANIYWGNLSSGIYWTVISLFHLKYKNKYKYNYKCTNANTNRKRSQELRNFLNQSLNCNKKEIPERMRCKRRPDTACKIKNPSFSFSMKKNILRGSKQ